jgi:hypothetical protein
MSRSSGNCRDWSETAVERIPRIISVSPIENGQLLVRFENGVEKAYDCRPLIAKPQFSLLKNPAFFRSVRVDPGGYGLSWNDNIDLSEFELWTNGQPIAEKSLRRTA